MLFLLLIFIFREKILQIVTSTNVRTQLTQQAFEVIKTQQDQIIKATKDALNTASEWFSIFYKTSTAYTKRDLEELQKKDNEIRNLRESLAVKERIIHEQEINQIQATNLLGRCAENVDNDNHIITKITNENDFYRSIYKVIQGENSKLLEDKRFEAMKIDYNPPSQPIKSANKMYKPPEYDRRKAEEAYKKNPKQ